MSNKEKKALIKIERNRKMTIYFGFLFLGIFTLLASLSVLTHKIGYDTPEYLKKIFNFAYVSSCIVFIIPFFMWLYRATANKFIIYENYPEINKPNALSPGGAIVWFFIPLFQIWKSYIMMKEIWFASNLVKYNDAHTPYPFIDYWWTLFFASCVGGVDLIFVFEEFVSPLLLYAIFCAYIITFFALTMRMVSKISAAQKNALIKILQTNCNI